MADVLTYSDFWFLSIIPMVLQSFAIAYLWKIRPYIGKKSANILFIKNIMLLGLYIAVTIALFDASKIQGAQPLERYGVYIDLIFPMGISFLFFMHLRALKATLSPNPHSSTDVKRGTSTTTTTSGAG